MEQDRAGINEPNPEKRKQVKQPVSSGLLAEGAFLDRTFRALDRWALRIQKTGWDEKVFGRIVDWMVGEPTHKKDIFSLPENHPTKIPPYK